MNKWIVICGIVCLVVIWQLLLLYKGFKETEVRHAERALAVTEAEYELAAVDTVDYYAGDGGYHVITGEDAAGEEVILWVKDQEVWKALRSEGISIDDIEARIADSAAEMIRIMPGMITTPDDEKQPIWEAYYVTAEGEARYEYFDFYSGKRIRKITLAVSS